MKETSAVRLPCSLCRSTHFTGRRQAPGGLLPYDPSTGPLPTGCPEGKYFLMRT